MRVLNVGGGPSREVGSRFRGWDQDLLDIDPNVKPNIVCDAKLLSKLPIYRGLYDAVYCSHTLEHFYKHEVPAVLAGFQHVLKKDGFAYITVPDMAALFEAVVKGDIDDTWYRCSAGPISFHDVLYGWGQQVERGNLFYCHKTGFTDRSLTKALRAAKFVTVLTARDGYNLHAFAFRTKPSKARLRALDL